MKGVAAFLNFASSSIRSGHNINTITDNAIFQWIRFKRQSPERIKTYWLINRLILISGEQRIGA